MKNFIKKLFIVFFLLNVGNNYPMQYMRSMHEKFKSSWWNTTYVNFFLGLSISGAVGIFLAKLLRDYEAVEKIKKKRKQTQRNLKSLKKALEKREKLRQEFKQTQAKKFQYMLSTFQQDQEIQNQIYDESFGIKKDIPYITERIKQCPQESLLERQQQYRNKMLKRRNDYMEEIAREEKIDITRFVLNWSSVKAVAHYCRFFYLRSFSKEELEGLNIEESPSKTIFKKAEQNKTYGEKAVKFVDEFLVLFDINPWNIKLGISGDTNKAEGGNAKYDAQFYGDKSTRIISAINVKDISLNLNFKGFREGEFFVNSFFISHEMGHLFEGHDFLIQPIPEQLRTTKSVVDLQKIFEVEADTAMLIRNKFVCFNALLGYVFRCIAFKNSNKLNAAFFNSISSIHASEIEQLIHATDIYLQIHEPKQDYDSALSELKSLLALELKPEIKNKTVNIQESISYFFDQDNYPEKFQPIVDRIIIDENYKVLPKYLPAK